MNPLLSIVLVETEDSRSDLNWNESVTFT